MSTTRVASIFFDERRADRSNSTGLYRIPAVPAGGDPFILTITDKIQREEGPFSSSTTGKTRVKLRYEVRGEDIAADLVAEWTQRGLNMNPQCHPGIWVVRERLPLTNPDGTIIVDEEGKSQWREATSEEKAAMWEEDLAANRLAQSAYGIAVWNEANALAQDERKIPFIPRIARIVAKHYGFTADWMKDPSEQQNKIPCPYCGTVVKPNLAVCPQCNNVVDVDRYAALEVAKKSALTLAIKESGRAA